LAGAGGVLRLVCSSAGNLEEGALLDGLRSGQFVVKGGGFLVSQVKSVLLPSAAHVSIRRHGNQK